MPPSRQPFKRAQRVGDVVRQIVSEALMTKIHHVGLEDVAITGVRVTDDMQIAHVFYRVIHLERRAEIAKTLGRLAGHLRHEVGAQLRMKYTPTLHFEYDESLEYGHRIDELLASVPKSASEEEE